ncbi:MAG: hypothetical protein L3J74_18545 [Bacteroidales bacterium]|nr:hypothetical protein [Bacteroidales bacterium]
MQIDFHYNTIRVLMEKLGFQPEDAQIIAYASQYVDDAVDHEEMKVNGHLELLSQRFAENSFNPVCTAHRGLQFLKGFKKSVQNKIYIPFHFLPDLEDLSDESASFLVRPNGKLAKKLVLIAKTELSKTIGEERIMNLIRLGIALHTYADTWAHQDFSGRHSHDENDVDDIEVYTKGKYEKISIFSKLEYDAFPDIGHAEVNDFPDKSYLKWRYKKADSKEFFERDNPRLFLQAAEHIIDLFIGANKDLGIDNLKTRLFECFSFETDNLEDKFKKFQQVFPEIGFYYDEYQWRNEALEIMQENKIKELLKDNNPSYVLGSDKKWFYFHFAAQEQREYILNLLKKIKAGT